MKEEPMLLPAQSALLLKLKKAQSRQLITEKEFIDISNKIKEAFQREKVFI